MHSQKNNLKKIKIKWNKEKCMTIVLCSKGYPIKYKNNLKIKNFNKIKVDKKSIIYHAGTIAKNNCIYSSGGRVLNITSIGQNLLVVRKKIIKIIKKINWNNGFYRSDIGWRIFKNNR